MSKKTLLLNAVQEMLDGNIDSNFPICENIRKQLSQSMLGYVVVKKLSTNWSNYSGEPSYPVSGEKIWNNGMGNNSFWWTGEQLELRMSLLEHIKSELLKLTDEEVEEMFGEI